MTASSQSLDNAWRRNLRLKTAYDTKHKCCVCGDRHGAFRMIPDGPFYCAGCKDQGEADRAERDMRRVG